MDKEVTALVLPPVLPSDLSHLFQSSAAEINAARRHSAALPYPRKMWTKPTIVLLCYNLRKNHKQNHTWNTPKIITIKTTSLLVVCWIVSADLHMYTNKMFSTEMSDQLKKTSTHYVGDIYFFSVAAMNKALMSESRKAGNFSKHLSLL